MDHLKFITLTKKLAEKNSEKLLQIIHENPKEYWGESELLYPLPKKFKRSLLLEQGEEVIGFIIASEKEEDTLHIHKINVKESFQGKGLGKTLLSYFLNKYSNKLITLKVHHTNNRAIKLYKNIGFSYLRNEEDYHLFRYDKKEG